MKNYLFLLPATLALLLSGCASVPMADKEHDRQAKSFAPKANMSNIYVYMDFRTGSGVTFEVTVDRQAVGGMTNGDFIRLEVPPGIHTVSTLGDLGAASLGENPVEVEMEAGKNYFFAQDFKRTGLFGAKNDLHLVDETAGRKGVSKDRLVLTSENVIQALATESKRRERKLQEAAIQRNFARPDKIIAPRPIAGNSGKYRSPFTVAGTVALWAQKPISETDNGSDLAANVGGAVGRQVANKVFENIPFVGGIIGQSVGESAARAATKKNIEPELPGMDAVIASSDISFNSVDKLAVYMYAKNSSHGQYARVLALAQRVYPELQDAYTPAIEKASQASDSKKGQSADERLDALKKLKDKGLITDADYLAKKTKIIDAM